MTIQGNDLVGPFAGITSASLSSGTDVIVAVQDVSGDPFGSEYVGEAYSASQCPSTGARFIVPSTTFGSDAGDLGVHWGIHPHYHERESGCMAKLFSPADS